MGIVRRSVESVRAAARLRRRHAHALHFYGAFLQRGDLCFDVGANVGARTALFLELGARVVAVEPHTGDALAQAFGDHAKFTLVRAALGPEPGERELFVPPGQDTLASMSPEWIERVRASGRFGEYEWKTSGRVPVTTFDALIAAHGAPVFSKIDVEGFEAEVLEGLSQPLRALSIEFTPEHLDATARALARLETLGEYEYTHSLGESLALASEGWRTRESVLASLSGLAGDSRTFGDVYARLKAGAMTTA